MRMRMVLDMRYESRAAEKVVIQKGSSRAPEFSLYVGRPIRGTAECPYGLSHPDRERTTADTLSKQSYRRKDSPMSHSVHSGEST
jgi:hypothetical protein